MIDPTLPISGANGAEWQIGGVQAPETATQDKGFGGILSDSIKSLEATQNDAAAASQALATGDAAPPPRPAGAAGQAADPTAVVMAVERAQLSMQLAGQIRTKAVEAANDIFHTQVCPDPPRCPPPSRTSSPPPPRPRRCSASRPWRSSRSRSSCSS